MGTKSEVAGLLPEITPFSLPEDPAGQALYDLATSQVATDAPGIPAAALLLAQTYYIAHLLCGKSGDYGITSERLGQYSVTRSSDTAGSSDWLALYQQTIRPYNRSAIVAASADGVPHADNEIADAINLDASGGWP